MRGNWDGTSPVGVWITWLMVLERFTGGMSVREVDGVGWRL